MERTVGDLRGRLTTAEATIGALEARNKKLKGALDAATA